MKNITTSSFKSNCFATLDEVQITREPVVITKRGKPVAKLVPIETKTDEVYNFLSGKGAITGDII